MSEVWKPVVGFEGFYEVSDHGRVRSLDRVISQRHHSGQMMKRFFAGQVLAPQVQESGHSCVNLMRSGIMDRRLIHLLVLEAFVGPRPEGLHTRHLSGNPGDNRLPNLVYGTRTENAQDALRHGVMQCSEGHYKAKINREIVHYIRSARGRERQVDLAARFGIAQGNVSAIQLGKIWKHV